VSPIPIISGVRAVSTAERVPDAPDRSSVYFEANVGQMHADLDFKVHGPGYEAFLSATQLVIRSQSPDDTPTAVRMHVIGGNQAARATNSDRLLGTVNYFLGTDPGLWRTNIPTFGRVQYDDVYPGIDLVYYGASCPTQRSALSAQHSRNSQHCLEYDFVVAPYADPSPIQLRFTGADNIEIAADGALVVETGAYELRQPAPYIYQEVNGTRRQVAGEFRIQNSEFGIGEPELKSQNSKPVTFEIGAYDPSRPLVIDPVMSYSTYLGGIGDDFSRDIRTDQAGNIYVAGHTSSLDFPTANGWQSFHGGGSVDAFVSKFSSDGSTLLYSSYLGGSGDDFGGRLAVDALGSVYLSGDTHSTDFPTASAVQPTNRGGADAFVTKLAVNGSSLRYSTYLGGSADDDGRGVAVDRFGSAYVTGRTLSSDFPLVAPLQSELRGGKDVFVTKLLPNGSAFAYSTYLGGSGNAEEGYSIAVNTVGNASITGRTDSSDFPTVNAVQPENGGGIDAFVARLAADGSALIYSTFLGGAADDHGRRLAVDNAGNSYVTGETFSTNFPTRNAFQRLSAGGSEAFVAKLSGDGLTLLYSTYLGGQLNDQAIAIAVSATGNAIVTGATESDNFPVVNAIQPGKNGNTDVFVTKFANDGSHIAYSTFLGGSDSDFGVGIAADKFGSAYVTGHTFSRDYPLVNAFQPVHRGGSDAFVSKIRSLTRVPAEAT
jgi:hypothetical protein